MDKSELFWQTYLSLENEFLDISRYVYMTDVKEVSDKSGIREEKYLGNLEAFSPHIADILLRICVEIEAISKELYFDLGGPIKRGDKNLHFDTDCLKLIDINYKTHLKAVFVVSSKFDFHDNENKIFYPLKNAHKSGGARWEEAYQAVKHDRYASLRYGSVKNTIRALGALYLLNIYSRNIKLIVKFTDIEKIDMSFGSKIFSLKKPEEQYVNLAINGNLVTETMSSKESPYILKFVDQQYQQSMSLIYENNSNRGSYFKSQPEYNDQQFQKELIEEIEKEKKDPEYKANYLCLLCQYRLNKLISKASSFEDKKKALLNTEEWRKANSIHEIKEVITESNIDNVINIVASRASYSIYTQLTRQIANELIFNGYCELVLDNGKIKYEI